jgi:hypothetical protein
MAYGARRAADLGGHGMGFEEGSEHADLGDLHAADGCQLDAIRAELADLRVKARSSWLAGLPADHF